MSLYEFVILKKDEQANAVWNGTFIADRIFRRSHVHLYVIEDFFVEVSYNALKNKIVRIRPFASRRLLEPYIKKVSIAEINGLL